MTVLLKNMSEAASGEFENMSAELTVSYTSLVTFSFAFKIKNKNKQTEGATADTGLMARYVLHITPVAFIAAVE